MVFVRNIVTFYLSGSGSEFKRLQKEKIYKSKYPYIAHHFDIFTLYIYQLIRVYCLPFHFYSSIIIDQIHYIIFP